MVIRMPPHPSVRARVMACLAGVVTVVAILLAVPSAHAAGWQRLTDPKGSSIDQVGLLRTPDGVLHTAWRRATTSITEDLLHTPITAAGKIGPTSTITAGWATTANPALVAAPGGLRVLFGGLHSTDSADPNLELNTAVSGDGGATWALQIGSIVAAGAQSYGSPVSASTLPDGTPLQAWAGTLGTWVHAGLDPATPNRDFQAAVGSYGYDPNIATNAGGATQMAWYSSANGRLGVLAQGVAADGSPIGSAITMPQTSDMSVGMLARTPLVTTPDGSFYVAYPTGYPTLNRVRVWKVGSAGTTLVGTTPGNAIATIGAAVDGRLWVAWTSSASGRVRALVRRSNAQRTRWGAVVDAGQPKGGASGYRLDASAAGAALDVLGVFSVGTSSDAATYHRRVLPGLTLQASPSSLRRGRTTTVTFTVLDAGDPVQGAKVTAGGRSATTTAGGKATLKLTGTGRNVTATATKTGYSRQTRRLKAEG